MHVESGCDQEGSEYFVSKRVCAMSSSHLDSEPWNHVPSKTFVSEFVSVRRLFVRFR